MKKFTMGAIALSLAGMSGVAMAQEQIKVTAPAIEVAPAPDSAASATGTTVYEVEGGAAIPATGFFAVSGLTTSGDLACTQKVPDSFTESPVGTYTVRATGSDYTLTCYNATLPVFKTTAAP